jgi:hypothetical protein
LRLFHLKKKEEVLRAIKEALNLLSHTDVIKRASMLEKISDWSTSSEDKLLYLAGAMAHYQAKESSRWKALCRSLGEYHAQKKEWEQSRKYWSQLDDCKEESDLCSFAIGNKHTDIDPCNYRSGWQKTSCYAGSLLNEDLR